MSDFLTFSDREVVEVTVPEWKGRRVHVRSLTAQEQLDLEAAEEGVTDPKRILALELVAYLCDETGNALLKEEAQGAQLVATKRTSVLFRIAKKAKKLNRWTAEDQDELQKNS